MDSFGKLTVLSRLDPDIIDSGNNNYNDFLLNNKKFIELPNIFTIKNFLKNYKRSKSIICEQIKSNELIIIRLPSIYGNMAFKYALKYNKKYKKVN